jgi:hypothetical protein
MNITITVSRPYVLVAGGWSGMRPVGLRRDYQATVNGVDVRNTSRTEIQRVIRCKLRRSGVTERVTFTFTDAIVDA